MAMEEDYKIVMNGDTKWHRQELLIKNSSVTLPDDLPVGSIAYTADGTYIAIWDGEDWVEWGGNSNE